MPKGCGRNQVLNAYFVLSAFVWYVTSCGDAGGSFLSIVGSSNFGVRSVERDLEVQFVIEGACTFCAPSVHLTPFAVPGTNAELSAAFDEEQQALFSRAAEVTASTFELPSRRVSGFSWASGMWIHLGVHLFGPYM